MGLNWLASMPDQYQIKISGCFPVSASYANFGVFMIFEQFLCPKPTFENTFREPTLEAHSLKVSLKVDFGQQKCPKPCLLIPGPTQMLLIYIFQIPNQEKTFLNERIC